MWLNYLILAAAIIGISYGLSVWSFSKFLEAQGIYQGDDGRFYSRRIEDDEEEIPPTFTYVMKGSVCEAFQVGSDVLPDWVQNDGIDVIISEPQRVITRLANDTTVSIPKGDWVVRFPDGTFGPLTADTMEDSLVKVYVEV